MAKRVVEGEVANEVTEATITTEEKKVRIHVVEPIDCIIAGVPYVFAKDKDVTVPEDVAAILTYSKKAYRL